MYNNNNNKRFQFCDKLTGDNSSPESILNKLLLLGMDKLRTLGKVTEVAKRVARTLSLPSAKPAF